MPQPPPNNLPSPDSSTSETSDQEPQNEQQLRELPPLRKRVLDWRNPDRERFLRRRAGFD
jgi:hypothetical protein